MTSGPDDVSVAIVDQDDYRTVAQLRARWTGVPSDSEFEARIAAWLAADADRRTTWIARQGNHAIGMTSLLEYRRMPRPGRPDSCWGYIGNMFVDEGCRNRGIGSRLLTAAIEAAGQRGYAPLVLSPSPRAIPFYERAGFIAAGPAAGDDRLWVRPAGPR